VDIVNGVSLIAEHQLIKYDVRAVLYCLTRFSIDARQLHVAYTTCGSLGRLMDW